ncbi:MAG: Trp biosynthesis-associated membrane protein, partial [Actinocatenispora sp.]
LLGGLVIAAVGGLTLRSGRRWPTMGSRYERGIAAPARVTAEDDPSTVWDALDSGDDPTAR